MTITLSADDTKEIIRHLINGRDHRARILAIINEHFLEFAIGFFKKVVLAKIDKETITIDWYEAAFLNTNIKPVDFAIHAGLNKKTIENSYGRGKGIVIDVSKTFYSELKRTIEFLINNNEGLDLKLTITLNDASVNLNITESLIVINTNAVKRAALRGGAWSSLGKQVEKPLMTTLCRLFQVPETHYRAVRGKNKDKREVDFYVIDNAGKEYECEVKLMGKGNPESADGAHAHASDIFVAATISQTGKDQCENAGMKWVELRSENGYRKFLDILRELNIPCADFDGDVNLRLDEILRTLSK